MDNQETESGLTLDERKRVAFNRMCEQAMKGDRMAYEAAREKWVRLCREALRSGRTA